MRAIRVRVGANVCLSTHMRAVMVRVRVNVCA